MAFATGRLDSGEQKRHAKRGAVTDKTLNSLVGRKTHYKQFDDHEDGHTKASEHIWVLYNRTDRTVSRSPLPEYLRR